MLTPRAHVTVLLLSTAARLPALYPFAFVSSPRDAADRR